MISGVKIASTGQVEPLNASNYCNGVHDNADYVNNAEFMSGSSSVDVTEGWSQPLKMMLLAVVGTRKLTSDLFVK